MKWIHGNAQSQRSHPASDKQEDKDERMDESEKSTENDFNVCKKCGDKLPANATFCSKCGKRVCKKERKPLTKRKKIILFTGCLLLCICAITGSGIIGYEIGSKSGYDEGFISGRDYGWSEGHVRGYKKGLTEGRQEMINKNDDTYWKNRAQYILEKNNYIPVKQFKITQEKNRSYTAKTETASEADAHYENALRKQYGDFTPSQLREKIEANEREINNTKNSAVAKGYANQNTYLTRILNEAEKKKKEQEKNSYYELVNKPDFQEKSKEIKKQGFFGDSKYKYINNLDGYRDKADLRSLSGGGSNDYDRYAYLSNNEKDIYNYLFAVKGKKEANKFLETIEIDLDGRKQDAA